VNRIVAHGILLCYFVIFISVSDAQDVAADNNGSHIAEQFIAPAVLVKGPVENRGFPLIYPNAIELWSGYYRYLKSEVIVSFTRKSILLPVEWEHFVCNKIEGFSPAEDSFFYTDKDWSVLFQFSKEQQVDCSFINIFIIRLKYFLRDTSSDSPPLLPAILEIP